MVSTKRWLRAWPLFLAACMTIWPQELLAPLLLNLRGNWTGTFTSNHSYVPSFTLSVTITSDSSGRVVGNSTLTSGCL